MPSNSNIRTKVVIRKLPPTYVSEEFLKFVSPIEDHNYYYFVTGSNSGEQFSRAYFNFLNAEDTNSFRDRYDGYVFLDQKGEEFIAQVEYAPYQKIPVLKSKIDSLSGTIESDVDYLKFVENLNKAEETTKPVENLLDSLEASKAKLEAEHEITPLVDFLKNKEDRKQKVREEKRSRRAERTARPPKTKPSRGSRKDRQKEKILEKKSKSSVETPGKTIKIAESKTEKSEVKNNTVDSEEIHVETIINNTKHPDKKDSDTKTSNEESKAEKGRSKHSYEKQRQTLKQRNDDDTSRTPSKETPHKPIKILKNPSKEGPDKTTKEPSTTKSEEKNEINSERDEASKTSTEDKNAGIEAKETTDDAKPKKQKLRYKDRPERPIYKPTPRRKE